MRYLTYNSDQGPRLGALRGDTIIDVAQLMGGGPTSLLELVQAGPAQWQAVAKRFSQINETELSSGDLGQPYDEKIILAPIPRPLKNVLCLGRNYYKHFLEGAVARGEDEKPPEAPIYFTKAVTTINGPFSPVELDESVTKQLDWEVELGLIIGVGGHKISKEDALNHVFGYTVINDLSARDLQFKHTQWYKGKSLDGSCPIGPIVVTPDELPDPLHVPIRLRVNGVTKQDANTGQMMFDIPTQIWDISQALTLEPGDIISTGTPDGVGAFANPPEFLKVGDIMETEVEGIGTMRNEIVAPSR
jgi:2-keto-4-pentenoate hydratase/2-oxohepta-3-ene-1,7-dioic acid hydratase in catechol pathway